MDQKLYIIPSTVIACRTRLVYCVILGIFRPEFNQSIPPFVTFYVIIVFVETLHQQTFRYNETTQ